MSLVGDPNFESSEKKKLTPEEFVHSLYRILLNREPDLEGFRSHVTFLKKTRDTMRTVNSFIESDEYKKKNVGDVVETASRLTQASLWEQGAPNSPAVDAVSERPPFDVEMVLEASRSHFRDVDFIYKLRNVPNL